MFPIRDQRGRTLGFGGRVLGDGQPKYLNSPETAVFHKGRELYGLHEAKRHLRRDGPILVVEGYLDVLALAQFGIRNVVATLGTAITGEHLQKLFRHASDLIFCFDGDAAGRRAARRAMEICLPALEDGRAARFLFLAEGDDPDTAVRRLGADAFRGMLESAMPVSDLLFQVAGAELDWSLVDHRARFCRRALALVDRLPQGMLRPLLLSELAERAGIALDTLRQFSAAAAEPPAAVSSAPPAAAPRPSPSDPEPPRRRHRMPLAHQLLLLLLDDPGLSSSLAEDLDRLDRDNPDFRLLHRVREVLTANP